MPSPPARRALDYAQGYMIGHPAPIVGGMPAMTNLTTGDTGPDQNDDAVNGRQEAPAPAAGAPADGQPHDEREQTFTDADQTSADSDQTAADSDQTAAESDQTAADSDQTAAESDQAASDRELEHGSDPQLHDATRKIRDRS